MKACETVSEFRPFYDVTRPIREKIETIARDVYGADGVDFSEKAEKQMGRYTEWGLGALPICMAKTHLSLSHDPKLRGAPRGFRVSVREIKASAGAGFLYPLCGDVMTMPGLPTVPASEHMDIDENGKVVGVLHPNYSAGLGMELYLRLLTDWVNKWGKAEYAL